MKEFYSNGKLLLSGEYAVLDGALAWAIPTKYGQYLKVDTNTSHVLAWKSLDEKNGIWFEGVYELKEFDEISSSNRDISEILIKVLTETRLLNPNFLINADGFEVNTTLTFPRLWGLGSSSTLINNIAQWASIDAFELLTNTFGGSGYDIACAQCDSPILFQRNGKIRTVRVTHNTLSFTASLYFVYLNQKKNSREGVAAYRQREFDREKMIKTINRITERMIASPNLMDFEEMITWHENTISEAMGIPMVKSSLFPDYPGAIKSLGAWGGDFILATGSTDVPQYFKEKGYDTVIPFSKMIL